MICDLKVIVACFCLFVYLNNDEIFVSAKRRHEKNPKNSTKPEKKLHNRTKEDRAALFSEPRIFPVLEHLLNPFIVPESSSFGVSPPVGIGPPFHPAFIVPESSSFGVPPPVGIGPPLHPGRPSVGSFIGTSRPSCAENGLFCLYDNNYPRDQINNIINRYYDEIRDMYLSLNRITIKDLLSFDNKTNRYREGGHFVCESKVEYVRPGWARNLRGEWLAIINTDTFPQVVRVEECKYANRRCEYLPPCYKSTCVQRYSFEKLLCVDPLRPEGRPFVDVFEIPNACSCFVENFVYY